MSKHALAPSLTRRELLRLSTTGIATLAFPSLTAAAEQQHLSRSPKSKPNLYAGLLHTWCDGLLARQLTSLSDPALHGALLCPACALVHGRCGDAVQPLLSIAHTTGDSKYLRAALLVHDWSERNVSRPDGSWINDVTLSSWQGITVFHAIALGEALHRHGSILDTATRQRWTDRLARAAKFLDGFITIETGNINYPITASFAFALCGQVLGDHHYTDRARTLAHTALDYFTPNGFLYGEGHPLKTVTPKGCHPVDLGYNVEESLPSLAQYALLTNDKAVLDQTIAALRTHLEFMLPDGAWDNSWGTRNYKWSWWGSRTSDGCHPACVLLAPHDPVFREAAYRNLELMAACTHNGLLYGGPDYFAHGDQPCIHHTFTHAKSLATVLDTPGAILEPTGRLTLPREQPYGLKTYPEIGTHLAAIGPWRATVTEYDWDYVEHVQSGGASGGGHVSGGALSLLYHRNLGPLLTASMTQYQMIEISNQQAFRDSPHMPLTPRIEYTLTEAPTQPYTNLNDFAAVLKATNSPTQIAFDASGSLLTAARQPLPTGDLHYHLTYTLTESTIEIAAEVPTNPSPANPPKATLRFILPVISPTGETVEQPDPKTIRILKLKGTLIIHTDAPQGFEPTSKQRTFNLVPGFECVPLTIAMQPGQQIRIQLETPPKK
jgi:hypothetical protein